ncbi:MAG: hypothetical protein ACRC33_22180 [Gemmataceae bacterium]
MLILRDSSPKATCPALAMTPDRRIDLALASLDPLGCVSRLADDHDVSRKFVYAQRGKARDALRAAFDPPPDDGGCDVLFRLDVTKDWLCRFVLAAVLIGHSSLRGAQEMIDCLLGRPVSLGWVHSVVGDAIAGARAVNDAEDLSGVTAVALDEIFQHRKPVLAVVDVGSTYCCALSREDHRDGDTWGVRLLELRDRGLAPWTAVADFGKGLRAGVRAAMPDLDCDADVWHPLRDLGDAARYLENRAYDAVAAHDKCRKSGLRPAEAEAARAAQDAAIALADDATTLLSWLRYDVLSVAGPPLARRRELFDMIVGELRRLEPSCEHRLKPIRSMLAAGRDRLLGFAARLDRDIAGLAAWAKVPEDAVREMVAVQETADGDRRKWPRDATLHGRLGGRYHEPSEAVASIRAGVVRASSVVENLNSRLRNYFFLRKEIGGGYLDLLRFFLNHRRFVRSEHPERVGKSPAELLTGKEHPHWLEMLGRVACQAA